MRLLYDDEALYVGVRLFDTEPSLISRRLSRRDEDADADRVTIYLDPMHDHLTGVYFRVSASGVQKDAAVFNDTWDDRHSGETHGQDWRWVEHRCPGRDYRA